MDDQLVAYALELLDPAERTAVEAHLATHPEEVRKLDRLRRALQPLEADREPDPPPPGLGVAAIGRTAEYLIAHRLIDLPHEPAGQPTPSSLRSLGFEPVFPGLGWRRADLAVAACIGFLAIGLIVSGIGKVRMESQVRGCQDNLRQLHQALVNYSSNHGGRLPKVGTDEVPFAGAFADELARAGQLPDGGLPLCPASSPTTTARFTSPALAPSPVSYAYTLGYLSPAGNVIGLRIGDGSSRIHDGLPISADLPTTGSRPHGRGMNVLYAGGAVRFSTTVAAGVNGDDIYRNAAGLARAGLHFEDSSLGRPDDVP